jgi:uncharacterized membrane protein YsdA (DUF1294 family)/cold shock CspA family protein
MSQRLQGIVSQWDADKGYGFITVAGTGERLFAHARAFGLRPHRPYVGEPVSFEIGLDGQGKRRAQKVRGTSPLPTAKPVPAGSAPERRDASRILLLIPLFAAWVLACELAWGLPRWLWGAYSAMSLATFIVYWGDKRAAQRGSWRVAEGTLHALALFGGWPGALLGQELLRHKCAKARFRRLFWATVLLNVLAFGLIFTPLVAQLLNRIGSSTS